MKRRLLSKTLLFCLPLALIFLATSCDELNCQEEICAPCPSSRFTVQYQDAAGNCLSDLNPAGMVYAMETGSTDTLYSYSFTDSCSVGFIIEAGLEYHVTGGGVINDVIQIGEFDFQEPVWVTECCACYPVNALSVTRNGDPIDVTFPAESYVNDTYVITVN